MAPLTASVCDPLPAAACVGLSAPIVGASAGSWSSAARSMIRGVVTVPPGRVSAIGKPVVRNAARISLTDAVGLTCRRSAQVPATCGVAIEVPLMKPKPPPGKDELMDSPGARSDKKDATFEKLDTTSFLVVEPTLIAVEMHPGALIELVESSFPDAITVAMPTERRLSMIALAGELAASHAD